MLLLREGAESGNKDLEGRLPINTAPDGKVEDLVFILMHHADYRADPGVHPPERGTGGDRGTTGMNYDASRRRRPTISLYAIMSYNCESSHAVIRVPQIEP